MVERPPTGTIPDGPGSYQFKDEDGRVIYVGKASSLRSRLSNYFQKHLPARTAQMVATAESVEWIQVANDVEALMLEYNLIKQHRPRFNVRLVDDKSYPFLAVTVGDDWPRPMVMRGAKRKGVRYYGPFAHAYAIRETLDLLLRTFPLRTCSDNKFNLHQKQGRPCLLFHIEKCSGPCVGEIDREAYQELIDELLAFLDGDTDDIVKRLEREMAGAADELEFERAARLRDRLGSVRKAIERQQMVAERNEDFDVLGLAEDELEAAVQVFFVRRGRVVGRKGFIVDKVEDLQPGELIGDILEGLYGEPLPLGLPKTVLVPSEPDDTDLYERWLSSLRGSAVKVRVPQRGDKRALQDTVTRNASEEFVRHRLRRSSDHNSRAKALNELQDHLGLPDRAAAHRVLRHEPHPGDRLRRLHGGHGGRAAQEVRVPPLQDPRCRRQRRLRGHGGGPDPPPRGLPGRAGVAGGRARGQVRLPAPAAARRRRQGPARGGRAGPAGARAGRGDPRSPPWPSASRRSTCPARPTPSASRGSPRRCTCSSGSATRPIASPSASTASCGASA